MEQRVPELAPKVAARPSSDAAAVNPAALELVERRIERSWSASESVVRGDAGALHAILDTRETMLRSLESLIDMIAVGGAPVEGRSETDATDARSRLLVQASLLQRANLHLMQTVRWEAARLAASANLAPRNDGAGAAYRAPHAERTPSLDLLR